MGRVRRRRAGPGGGRRRAVRGQPVRTGGHAARRRFPRISGIFARVDGGELWLTTEAGSAIANALRREPRCSLHSGPVDGSAPHRDAKPDHQILESWRQGEIGSRVAHR